MVFQGIWGRGGIGVIVLTSVGMGEIHMCTCVHRHTHTHTTEQFLISVWEDEKVLESGE